MHYGKRQTDVFRLKSHHTITMSSHRTKLHEESQTDRSWLLPCINLAFLKVISKSPHSTTLLFVGSVTRLCGWKCRIFLLDVQCLLLSTVRRTQHQAIEILDCIKSELFTSVIVIFLVMCIELNNLSQFKNLHTVSEHNKSTFTRAKPFIRNSNTFTH